MSQNPQVTIVGAGFSGLTLAWALNRKNISVQVIESSSKAGGLIQTDSKEILVESAANALLNSADVEDLFQDLKLEMIPAGFRSKKRWIYRQGFRKWPLSIVETLLGIQSLLKSAFTGQVRPKAHETLADWGERCLGSAWVDYLLSPAFQGVYGTTADQIQAELILGGKKASKISTQKRKLKFRGSVAPEKGMGSLIQALVEKLKSRGVQFKLGEEFNLQTGSGVVVLATSMSKASEILKFIAPETSEKLSQIPMLPLGTVALGFQEEKSIQGFGALFPEKENQSALGVLFNTDIFPGRGSLHSETWIVGSKILSAPKTEDQVLEQILKQRKKLWGEEKPQFSQVKVWPQAIPLYGSELRSFLNSGVVSNKNDIWSALREGAKVKEARQDIYLTGNYLGGLGLAKILSYNHRLVARIEKDLKT